MTDKTSLWDKLGKTDPAHVKGFKRAGGFSGTAIKPMWSFRRMTEEFGPCGDGWGVNEPSFQVVPGPEGEVLVYCIVSIWHGSRDKTVFGVGGDKAVGKNKYGLSTDDEAFKKAFTDAVTNALKLIGVGADVHMGLFDDNKYVASVRGEFSEERAEQTAPPPRSSASLKRTDANGQDAWERLTSKLHQELLDCKTTDGIAFLRGQYREEARKERWPKAWLDALANEFDQAEDRLMSELEQPPTDVTMAG